MKTSNQNVNLLWLTANGTLPEWNLGSAYQCDPSPAAISDCLKTYLIDIVSAWLFWDPAIGLLEPEFYQALLAGPADVWHAGLSLGLQGQPEWIDFVSPTWMLNLDPDPGIQSSSWRLSLRACLIRTEVLRQMGGLDPHFESLEGAGLALGFRYIRQGAFVQHVPGLVTPTYSQRPPTLPLADQVRFILSGLGRKWTLWAGFRAVIHGSHPPVAILRAIQRNAKQPAAIPTAPYQRSSRSSNPPFPDGQVTVLIPTINRYTYLRTLLGQIRHQTIPPLEVIVVDQTPPTQRNSTLQEIFTDLPLRWLMLDQAGQCSSRNLGLQKAKGDYILFLDDDDEIPPDLIEKHLSHLAETGINISNGVANEVGAGELPPDFQFKRTSNVFPTNNTMIRKQVLHQSGLFDLAYDHGQRADHDLGMRLYLSGELMALNPEIQVLHHHAPQGGLREHKARVDTYSHSRRSILKLNLPTVSDFYFAKRYFSARQVREMIWISYIGTFSLRGPWWKSALKTLVSAFRLPWTIWQIHKRLSQAQELLKDFPQIPHLEES